MTTLVNLNLPVLEQLHKTDIYDSEAIGSNEY